MTTYDYAHLYEAEYRRGRRLRRLVARVLWTALFLVRPKLALDIWQGR